MTEWQLIDTAPKMKNILLWAATDIADTGEIKNWKMDTGYWSEGAQCWTWSGNQVRKYDIQPTHWMRLPRPPGASAAVTDKILPCPFCGYEAATGSIGEGDDAGGHFIQCTNGLCGASTNLRFACGDDPKPLLLEQWNKRTP